MDSIYIVYINIVCIHRIYYPPTFNVLLYLFSINVSFISSIYIRHLWVSSPIFLYLPTSQHCNVVYYTLFPNQLQPESALNWTLERSRNVRLRHQQIHDLQDLSTRVNYLKPGEGERSRRLPGSGWAPSWVVSVTAVSSAPPKGLALAPRPREL